MPFLHVILFKIIIQNRTPEEVLVQLPSYLSNTLQIAISWIVIMTIGWNYRLPDL